MRCINSRITTLQLHTNRTKQALHSYLIWGFGEEASSASCKCNGAKSSISVQYMSRFIFLRRSKIFHVSSFIDCEQGNGEEDDRSHDHGIEIKQWSCAMIQFWKIGSCIGLQHWPRYLIGCYQLFGERAICQIDRGTPLLVLSSMLIETRMTIGIIQVEIESTLGIGQWHYCIVLVATPAYV